MLGHINSTRDIGLVVRQERERHGMSQRTLAAKLGVSQRYLSELERGVSKIMDDKYINTLKLVGLHLRYELADG